MNINFKLQEINQRVCLRMRYRGTWWTVVSFNRDGRIRRHELPRECGLDIGDDGRIKIDG